MKIKTPLLPCIAAAAAVFSAQPAAACSPNLPNYGNCVRQQQEAQRQQQIQGARQQQQLPQRQQQRQGYYPAPRPMTPEEERALEIVFNGDPAAPRGCNPTLQDGRFSCWEYINDPRMGMVFFSHVSPGYDPKECIRNPRRCYRHGLNYTYGTDGRLHSIDIYSSSIILKGENTYAFLADGTVDVYDHKRNNDPDNFKNIYKISTDEALSRLNLPKSILNIGRLTVDTKLLAQKATQLPAGCPGTADSKSWFGNNCSIKTLWGKKK